MEGQQKKLEEAFEENAALDFERARVKDGYGGPLRRIVSYTSAEFLNGSHMQLSGSRSRIQFNSNVKFYANVNFLELFYISLMTVNDNASSNHCVQSYNSGLLIVYTAGIVQEVGRRLMTKCYRLLFLVSRSPDIGRVD